MKVRINADYSVFHGKVGYGYKSPDGGWIVEKMGWFTDAEIQVL